MAERKGKGKGKGKDNGKGYQPQGGSQPPGLSRPQPHVPQAAQSSATSSMYPMTYLSAAEAAQYHDDLLPEHGASALPSTATALEVQVAQLVERGLSSDLGFPVADVYELID